MPRKNTPRKNALVRLVSAVLMLIVLFSFCAFGAAAKKPALSRTSVTMETGGRKTISLKNVSGKLTGKVKWSVSGKQLITVTPGGKNHQKVTIRAGSAPGTCTLVAKAVITRSGKKTFRCKVMVKKAGAFQEQEISGKSVDCTQEIAKSKTSGKKTDSAFTLAMAKASVSLLQEVLKDTKENENVLISPDSVLTALSLAESGASGATLSEMEKALGGISAKKYRQYLLTLHKRLTKEKAMTYKVANSVWYRKNKIRIKSSYLKDAVNYFDAQIYSAPFNSGTVSDMNAWAYNHTNGKIRKIISQLESTDRLVLLNAIYFKGSWADPYVSTVTRDFTRESGGKQSVPMLEGTEKTYVTVNGAEGFVKPYSGGQTAFLGLLPPEGMSAKEFAASLTGKDLADAYRNRITKNILVRTRMPEFRYEYTVSLQKAVQNMGIRKAFSGSAAFRKMTSDQVNIDEILHKTFIDLNKDGTEAAAVTAILMKATAVFPPEQPQIKEVYLDRPFVYAIIDVTSGIPLFLGVVNSVPS